MSLRKIGLAALAVLALCFTLGCSSAASGASSASSASTSASASASTSASASASTSASASEPAPATTPRGSLTVRFLDVGQGDAALLESQGHWLLIDGGPSDASRKLYTVLKNLGVDQLDAVIATHPDADHIAGLSGALNYATCGALYCSVDQDESPNFDDLLKYAKVDATVPVNGDQFTLGDVTVTFLRTGKAFPDKNNNSLVVRVECAGRSFLFMGDAETDAEAALLQGGASLRADVLHVSHHGSLDATSEGLLKAVRPAYALVSVGANDYGHPSERVMERLVAAGADVLRTDQLGDVTVTCVNGALSVATEKSTTESPTAPGAVLTPVVTPDPVSTDEDEADVHAYVLNTNTKKFHYPDCASVGQMKEKNKQYVEATREDVRSWGYDPCGNCKP